MAITAEQVKTIRQELNSLKPASVTLEGNAEMSVKQIIFALADTLERMKKRGFEMPEIIQRLHEKGIEIKPQTLTKYLAEARRKKDVKKTKRQAANPHCSAPKTACRNEGPQAADTPPKQTPTVPQGKLDKQQKQIDWGDDEDWVRPRTDYSSYGKFKITPDTPAGEL